MSELNGSVLLDAAQQLEQKARLNYGSPLSGRRFVLARALREAAELWEEIGPITCADKKEGEAT